MGEWHGKIEGQKYEWYTFVAGWRPDCQDGLEHHHRDRTCRPRGQLAARAVGRGIVRAPAVRDALLRRHRRRLLPQVAPPNSVRKRLATPGILAREFLIIARWKRAVASESSWRPPRLTEPKIPPSPVRRNISHDRRGHSVRFPRGFFSHRNSFLSISSR